MLTLNPGFVLIAAALLLLATPKGLRVPSMAGAAVLAIWLMLDREFGAAATMAQMGVPVVLLNLDPLNRIFGIAMLIATVLIAIYSGARRNRFEDAAFLLLAGGAVSALFVGDLVSFVAAAELAALAMAGVVFASTAEGAGASGVRLLIWFGLEGLLFLVGAALHLSAGADSSIFTRLDVRQIGDAFIFAALLIRVGAPFAHVWFKDAVRHASPVGAPALTAFSTTLGVYALARLFPAEPILIPIGVAVIAIGLLYVVAENDLRAAGAAGMSAVIGVCLVLIGVGSPLALAAAAAHAFAGTFVFVALQMVLGAIVERQGSARLSSLAGLWRAMPITATLLLFCGLATAAAPGTAMFATLAVTLDALARWETNWLWVTCLVIAPIFFASLALRPAFAGAAEGAQRARNEAPFAMLLGSAVASFFCISIGIAPGWLYAFLPSEMTYQPLSLSHIALQLEILGAAGLTYAVLWALGLAPQNTAMRLWDVDAFYRGPLSNLARWVGIIMLRVYGASQSGFARFLDAMSNAASRWVRSFDRPYAAKSFAWAQFALIALVLLVVLLFREF
ncbi:MAG: proton-conducting transporter membrane subunit [Vitreimonas sp.]